MKASKWAGSSIRAVRRLLSPLRRGVQLRILKIGYKKWLEGLPCETPGGASPDVQLSPEPAARKDGSRPRVLFLADGPRWAQDRSAQAVSRRLSDEFEFHIAYRDQSPDLAGWEFDLVYVLFWGEVYQREFVQDPRRIIKQISSHRWITEKRYGRLSAPEAAYVYFRDAATLTTPSRRLQAIFSPYREVLLAQKGFEPDEFAVKSARSGRLRIGWAGDTGDKSKGLTDVLMPAMGSDFELMIAGGDHGMDDMADFYNSIDVICIASHAEGDPLTLIEGMACGCFPVAVDVGIVPELVRQGDNGLIVERDPADFRAALEWCAENVGRVREAGLRNAEQMLETRTWDQTSRQWREVLRFAHARLDGPVRPSDRLKGTLRG